MASPNIVIITDKNFEQEVMKSPVPVLVDFWAEWCGPCKMIAPALDEIAGEYAGKAKIAKVNVDENQTLAAKFNVMSIPALFLVKGGQVIGQAVGAKSKSALKAMIDGALK
ncbi:MAG: thioredoxin [Verrucomicrobiota bacterium]